MPPRHRLAHAALLLTAAALPACGVLPGFGGNEDDLVAAGTHVVFLTRADCSYAVTKAQGSGSFAVVAFAGAAEARTLNQGDLLVGDLREGPFEAPLVPFPGDDGTAPLSFRGAGADLPFPDAQDLWRRVCPDPPEPVPADGPTL